MAEEQLEMVDPGWRPVPSELRNRGYLVVAAGLLVSTCNYAEPFVHDKAVSWLILLGAVIGSAVLSPFHNTTGREQKVYRRLAGTVSEAEKWPVRVTIRQGGVTTGSDFGILSFRAGLLRFDGSRTWFAIPNTLEGQKVTRSQIRLPWVEIEWDRDPTLHVRIAAPESTKERIWTPSKLFAAGLMQWARHRSASGEIALPTAQLQPELDAEYAATQRKGYRRLAAGAAALALILCAFQFWAAAALAAILFS